MARQLARTGSFSGVWWKLGDDADEQRRLADEEAAVKARIQRRHATARRVRRTIAFTSLTLEAAAFVYGWWMVRRRSIIKMKNLLMVVLLYVPACAALLFACFARFHKFSKPVAISDQQKLDRLRAERYKAKMRGSHHNMQKLLIHSAQESVPDSPAAATKTERIDQMLVGLCF
ncbi:hypothetical protein E2562_025633 [Oryza meyeriana var. granulata]|uniref:Uncharacterized protein n=1 Tax=Oryza meyeriana var. granulata TaxID=110450 RepID=A0A6G1FC81_9ORYZ|nr:hypothetical protein E2562_025633 [Oryza meyeriana var. granulata]